MSPVRWSLAFLRPRPCAVNRVIFVFTPALLAEAEFDFRGTINTTNKLTDKNSEKPLKIYSSQDSRLPNKLISSSKDGLRKRGPIEIGQWGFATYL